jgi:hypothetical protein
MILNYLSLLVWECDTKWKNIIGYAKHDLWECYTNWKNVDVDEKLYGVIIN